MLHCQLCLTAAQIKNLLKNTSIIKVATVIYKEKLCYAKNAPTKLTHRTNEMNTKDGKSMEKAMYSSN